MFKSEGNKLFYNNEYLGTFDTAKDSFMAHMIMNDFINSFPKIMKWLFGIK